MDCLCHLVIFFSETHQNAFKTTCPPRKYNKLQRGGLTLKFYHKGTTLLWRQEGSNSADYTALRRKPQEENL